MSEVCHSLSVCNTISPCSLCGAVRCGAVSCAGRGEMWSALVAHMAGLTALKRMPQDDLARLFTQAFVAHIAESDRARFERKVLKTLQLAIMPKEVCGCL